MPKRFEVYRYQIVPVSRRQLTLFEKPISEEDLKANKNEYFFNAVNELVESGEFQYRDHDLAKRVLWNEDDILVLQFAIDRGRVPVEMPDFTEERFQTYPNFIVGFNNDPLFQYLFIEREYKAFRKTHTAADMLQSNINDALEKYMLHIEINPIFDVNEFWELVKKYPSIYYVDFEMVAPNLTNIHGAIEDSIKNWFPNTNSQTIDIEMNSDKNSSLNLQKGVEPITSFSNYASRGGGNISIKAKEVKYKISTKDSVHQIVCHDLEIESDGTVAYLEELIGLLRTNIQNDESN